jgi:trigger factor
LKITQAPLDNHQVELTVEIENDQMESAKRRAARKLSERGKVPGFRPGKAPYDVVRRHYGDEAILEQALDLLVDEVYPKALEQEKIEPAAIGSLEKIENMDPAKFVFRVPLQPTVELGDYRSIRQPYEFTPPGEDKVEASIQELRRMYATTQAVERPIEYEDFVLVDLRGEKAKPKEGEEALVAERKGHAVYIAKELRQNEFPYQGFSSELLGLKVGENKTVTHKFGKDVDDDTLRGATVKYEVEIKSVRGMKLPELDDEFARMAGAGESIAELRENVRKNLEAQSQEEYDDEYFTNLIDKVKAGATIKYPPQIVEHEAEHVLEDLKERLSQQGMEYETFLKIRQMDEAKFMEEEAHPVAVRRLERRLIMDELIRTEQITLDDEALKEEFSQTWAALAATNEEFNKATQGGTKSSENLMRAVTMDVAARLMTRQVLDRIKEIAAGQAGDGGAPKAKKTRAKKAAAQEDSPEMEPASGLEGEPAAPKPKKRAAAKKSE